MGTVRTVVVGMGRQVAAERTVVVTTALVKVAVATAVATTVAEREATRVGLVVVVVGGDASRLCRLDRHQHLQQNRQTLHAMVVRIVPSICCVECRNRLHNEHFSSNECSTDQRSHRRHLLSTSLDIPLG